MLTQEFIRPVLHSRTLRGVAGLALVVGLYAILAVWKENSPYSEVGDIPSEVHTSLTMVLGFLLVFRTNAAYSRWWEARTLWGGLVNASRNLTIKISTLPRSPRDEVEATGQLIAAFPKVLKNHLRSEAPDDLAPWLVEELHRVQHAPGLLVSMLYTRLSHWKQQGWIDGDELRVIDRELARLLDICGGCERILRTRIVRSYRTFARQCVLIFLLTLPWGIVNTFQWWTIPLTAITAYFMLGMEIVAEHVEEPFGYDDDDLDLDGLCHTIEASVTELLSSTRLSNTTTT